MIKAAALLVVLALAGILVLQWRDWPRPLSPVGPPRSDQGAAADPGAAADASLTTPAPPEAKETYASVAERPLFRPQRKPEPPPAAEPTPEPEAVQDGTLEGLDLSAVLISPGATSAWITDPSAPQIKRLRLGDEQAGWSVKAILADRVVFERQGETNELLLRDFSQTPASPPAAPAPVPVRPNPAGRPNPAAPGQLKPPSREPQRKQAAGADQRVAPPKPPQPRPNGRRPAPQRPQ